MSVLIFCNQSTLFCFLFCQCFLNSNRNSNRRANHRVVAHGFWVDLSVLD